MAVPRVLAPLPRYDGDEFAPPPIDPNGGLPAQNGAIDYTANGNGDAFSPAMPPPAAPTATDTAGATGAPAPAAVPSTPPIQPNPNAKLPGAKAMGAPNGGPPQTTAQSAIQNALTMQPPAPPGPAKWYQKLAAMAEGAAGGYVNAAGRTHIDPKQIAAAEQETLAPGYARQVGVYQQQQQDALAKAGIAEKLESVEGLKTQREAQAQKNLAAAGELEDRNQTKLEIAAQKAKDAAEQTKIKQQQAADAVTKLQLKGREEDAHWQKESDPVPKGMEVIQDQAHPGYVYVAPPSNMVVQEGMNVPGKKTNDVMSLSEFKNWQKAQYDQQKIDAKPPKDPSSAEQLLDTTAYGAAVKAGIHTQLDTSKPILPQLQKINPGMAAQVANDFRRDPNSEALKQLQMTATSLLISQRQAQQGPPPEITHGTPEFKVAQDLAYGKITMQQFRSLYGYSRDVNKKLSIYNKASELNPNFNPAAFEMGYKFASTPKTQGQMAALDNVVAAIPDLLKLSDAATRSGATVLNKYIIKGGIMLGGKKYSNLATARAAFADELSGALGFGSATDMKLALGKDMTDINLSPENFTSAIQDVVHPFIDRKRDTMLKQMGVYGQPGMNPAAPAAAAAVPAPSGTERPPLSSFEK